MAATRDPLQFTFADIDYAVKFGYKNLHSKTEARIYKYSIASDEAEVLKYYRDSKDPEIEEMHP